MKINKSVLSVFLSLIFCLTLLPVPALAAEGVTLSIAGGSTVTLDLAAENTISVPVFYEEGVDSYTIPEITVKNGDAAVDVIIPEELPGNASFTIDGTEYTVALEAKGANMYENGGNEEAMLYNYSNFILESKGYGMSIVTDTAYTGSHSVQRPGGNNAYFYIKYVPGQPVLQPGTTYLSSLATRVAPAVEGTYVIRDCVRSLNKEQSAQIAFYENDAKITTGEGAEVFSSTSTMTADWKQLQAVIVPTTAFDVMHFPLDNSWGKGLESRLDDFFLGELSVGKVEIKNAEGATASAVLAGEETTIALSGAVLNQLGTKSGFENETLAWTASSGITVDASGNVTIPADAAPGVYTVTATADIETNEIGAVSGSHTIKVLSNAAMLSSLTIEGNGISKLIFDAETTEYTVGVPVRYAAGVDSYTFAAGVPTISATPMNPAHQAVVTMPEVLPGVATVEVKEGEYVLNTYRVNLVALGANMYENGGFEENALNFYRTQGGVTWARTSADAFTGTYSALRPTNYSNVGVMYKEQQSLKLGKTYISSYATRLNVGETPASPYRVRDFVISNDSTQAASVDFYLDGTKYQTKEAAQKHEYASTNIDLSENWNQLQAVITPTTATYDVLHYYQDAGGRKAANLLDDIFLGELIISGIEVLGNGAALPAGLHTESEQSITLTAQALNQLGAAAGVSDKTAVALALASAPEGVTLDGGVLTIPAGAYGTVTLKATATPTEAWTTAPQESFTETITIALCNDSFNYAAADGTVTTTLSYCNEGDADVTGVVYRAVYNKAGDVLTLASVTSEDITIPVGAFVNKSSAAQNVASGQVIKSFLWWKDGSLKPEIESGIYPAQ